MQHPAIPASLQGRIRTGPKRIWWSGNPPFAPNRYGWVFRVEGYTSPEEREALREAGWRFSGGKWGWPEPEAAMRNPSRQTACVPPIAVAQVAARGLQLRRCFGRGGTAVGVARARDLSNRRAVSDRTLRRMKAYFDRHAVDATAKGSESTGYWSDGKNPSAGYIAWLIWGGDPGRKWAEQEVRRIEAMKRHTSARKTHSARNPSPGSRSKHYSKPYRTKQGQHGTMYLYEFTLRFSDPGAPEDKARYWGYDADHAYEKLRDNMTHQGWNYRTEYNIVGEPHRVRE